MTDERVSRRKLLAAAGTILVAGCGSDNSGQDGFGTRFARDSTTRTRTATRTRTRTETDSGAEINVDTRTETETRTARGTESRTEQTPPEDQTPTETPTPMGGQALTAARANLQDAVEEFRSYGGSSLTLTSVTAASVDFDKQSVLDELSTARSQLTRAAESGEVDQQRIRGHREFATFLERLADTQARMVTCYEDLQTVLDHLYAEEVDEAQSALSQLELSVEEASNEFNGFTEATDASSTAALEIITEQDYEDKTDQIESELSGFEDLFDPVGQVRRGLDDFGPGIDAYTSSDWGGAQSDLFSALNGFEMAYSPLSTMAEPPSLSGTVATLTEAVEHLQDGTELLYESARAGSNGEDGEREQSLSRAISEYRGSDRVENLPSFQQLVEETDV